HNYLVTEVEEIAPTIREAFFLARSGRPGPVLVDICKDAQQATAIWRTPAGQPRLPGYRPSPHASDDLLDQAVHLINHAERPVVLAGYGIIKAEAGELLRQFVEKAHVPVASTLLGLGGFPASHPLALGMMGMH